MQGVVKNQEEAEDIAAWAFATAFHERKKFRGDSAFYTWVHRIALNHVWTLARRKPMLSLDGMEGPEPAEFIEPDLLERALERSECCRRIRNALRKIPARYRRTLVDRYMRRLRVRRIARKDRIPVGTVLSRIFTAKRILREVMVGQQA